MSNINIFSKPEPTTSKFKAEGKLQVKFGFVET